MQVSSVKTHKRPVFRWHDTQNSAPSFNRILRSLRCRLWSFRWNSTAVSEFICIASFCRIAQNSLAFQLSSCATAYIRVQYQQTLENFVVQHFKVLQWSKSFSILQVFRKFLFYHLKLLIPADNFVFTKSCFKMSAFWTVYLKNSSKTAQELNGFERFI